MKGNQTSRAAKALLSATFDRRMNLYSTAAAAAGVSISGDGATRSGQGGLYGRAAFVAARRNLAR